MSTSEDEEENEYTFVHERDLRGTEGQESKEVPEVPMEVSEEGKDSKDIGDVEGDVSSDVEGETEMPKLETIDSEACLVFPKKY